MLLRLLLALGIAAMLRAQQDPRDLLLRVQQRVINSLKRLPRYMCTETIDRSEYRPNVVPSGTACDQGPNERPIIHLASSDRLRLDVSVSSTDEMYGWVGENHFDDRNLLDLVNDGALSTGGYVSFLSAVFTNEGAIFTYNGEKIEDGGTVSEYGFRVPYEKSHYFFHNRTQQTITAYDGTFLVDPKTTELVQLVILTSQLPPDTGVCSASNTLEYGHVHLQGTEFILPSVYVMRIFSRDGSQAENRSVFSRCHEFHGESTISFDPPANVSGTQATVTPDQIPSGVHFRVALTQGIDTSTAAAGDALTGKLTTPIRNGSKVLVPAGAAVKARIVRIKEFYGTSSSVLLLVKLESVDVGRSFVPLTAVPEFVGTFQKSRRGALQHRVELGSLGSLEERSARFEFRTNHFPYLVGSGLESGWITTTSAAYDSLKEPQR